MLNPIIYHLLLIAVAAYAFLRGRSDERLAAAICVVATIATRLVISPVVAERYSGVELGVFIVDLLTLAGFVAIALRTDRFWPLWVAGLQLTTLVAHFLKAIQLDLLPHAYAAAGRFWVYPIFLIIVVGTWRSHHRAQADAQPRAA